VSRSRRHTGGWTTLLVLAGLLTGSSSLSTSQGQEAAAPPPVEAGPGGDPASILPVIPPPATVAPIEAAQPPVGVDPVPTPSHDVPLDDQAERVQATAPLAGGAGAPGSAPAPGAPFVIAPDSLPVGVQTLGLSVQVFAPATMNLNKESTVTIQVKNSGQTDVRNVVVRDILPPGTQFVSSQPETQPPAGDIVSWFLDLVPPGTERLIKVVLRPTLKGSQDHAVTLQVMAGSRARTQVLQPDLRVETSIRRTEVLKGQQVQVDINVTNTGDGPARNVVVQAELSAGLDHSEGRIVELPITVLTANQSLPLEALFLKAVEGGEQTVTVTARSPDVVPASPDAPVARSMKTVRVVEPRLQLEVAGPGTRYTDSDGEYTITLTNPGTAPAEDVRLTATLVGDGPPFRIPDATWDPAARKWTWTIGRVEAGGPGRTVVVKVRYGGLGLYKVDAEAVGRGGVRDVKTVSTSIEGNADVDLSVKAKKRVIDVGESTYYAIVIKNMGTKEARKLQVNAELSDTLTATDMNAPAGFGAMVDKDTQRKVVFKEIPALAPGTEIELGVYAKATKAGVGSCRVFASHDDLRDFGEGRLEKVDYTKILGDTMATSRADRTPPR
jgi:uncharacterized repeat protein (TIGR01451 family)